MLEPGTFHLLNVFTGQNALGNPCCVLFLDDLQDSHRLHGIAKNFNQPATAFVRNRGEGEVDIRWFAPESEIDLCGHGALAATKVILAGNPAQDSLVMHYGDGQLEGRREGRQVSISGDAIPCNEAAIPDWLTGGFGESVIGYYPSVNKHVVVVREENAVVSMQPNWKPLIASGVFSFAVTARSKNEEVDFVSRVFLPQLDMKEDQATGSAHMVLAPYWSKVLEKDQLNAFQASARGGRMKCEVMDDRVKLTAACTRFGEGRMKEEA
ncbi:MAG: PhzF family phenazine biosynthesis protein [Cryomorphaceae bacterium]